MSTAPRKIRPRPAMPDSMLVVLNAEQAAAAGTSRYVPIQPAPAPRNDAEPTEIYYATLLDSRSSDGESLTARGNNAVRPPQYNWSGDELSGGLFTLVSDDEHSLRSEAASSIGASSAFAAVDTQPLEELVMVPAGAAGGGSDGAHHCPFCPLRFEKQYTFKEHLRVHTRHRPYQCMLCGRAFSQSANIRRHILTHKVFPHLINAEPSRYKSHFGLPKSQIGQPEEPTQCFYCPKYFNTRGLLSLHLNKEHQREKRFVCAVSDCGYVCEYAPQLLQHEADCHAQLPRTYNCPHCQQVFDSLEQVGDHQQTEHAFAPAKSSSQQPAVQRTYKCDICQRPYGTASGLRAHLQRDTHRHACSRCPVVLSSSRKLARHMRAHRACYKCSSCDRTFSYKSAKLRHERTQHNTLMCYRCSRCDVSFGRHDALLRHNHSLHAGHRRFVCAAVQCGKAFTRCDQLRQHSRTVHAPAHVSRNCDKCDGQFKHARSLQLHSLAQHSASQPALVCDHCQLGFTRKSSLKVHIQRQHLRR